MIRLNKVLFIYQQMLQSLKKQKESAPQILIQNQSTPSLNNPRDNPHTPSALSASRTLPDMKNIIMEQFSQTLHDKLIAGIEELSNKIAPIDDKKKKDDTEKQQCLVKNQFLKDIFAQLISIIQSNHQKGNALKCLNPIIIGIYKPKQPQSQIKKNHQYVLLDFTPLSQSRTTKDEMKIELKGEKAFVYQQQLQYIAPEGNIEPLKEWADIWSLGCIMYEILSHGDPLLCDPIRFHRSDQKVQQQIIKDRMRQLSQKGKWMCLATFLPQILQACLSILPSKRPTLKGLKQLLTKPLFTIISEDIKKLMGQSKYQRKINFDLSMEILRLQMIMDSMLSILEQFAYNSLKTLQKWHVYPLLKFASCYYLDVLARNMGKAWRYSHNNKYSQIKFMKDWKAAKAKDIKDKAADKVEREMRKRKQNFDLFNAYPEIRSRKIVYPKRVFIKFLNEMVLDQLCSQQNLPFYKHFYSIVFYIREMGEIENSPAFLSKIRDQEKEDPDVLFFKISKILTNYMDDTLKKILKECSTLQKSFQAKQLRRNRLLQLYSLNR